MRFVKLWYEYAKTIDISTLHGPLMREGMEKESWAAWKAFEAAMKAEGLHYETLNGRGVQLSNGDKYLYEEPL